MVDKINGGENLPITDSRLETVVEAVTLLALAIGLGDGNEN